MGQEKAFTSGGVSILRLLQAWLAAPRSPDTALLLNTGVLYRDTLVAQVVKLPGWLGGFENYSISIACLLMSVPAIVACTAAAALELCIIIALSRA